MYLGQDENISYIGTVNKERVSKEYFTKVGKIWKSKLLAFNKATAHNIFAVPVLKPAYGILDCTIKEIRNIDIKTRKVLSMTGNFHINSDVDCLCIPGSEGGDVDCFYIPGSEGGDVDCLYIPGSEGGDVDCLYIPGLEGNRGLRAIQTAYEYGMVSLTNRLTGNGDRNQLLSIVCRSGGNGGGGVAGGLCCEHDIAVG